MGFESLRREYRPEVVRVLFVGESRPAGGTFFYARDSLLYHATRDAFLEVYGEACGRESSFPEFLKRRGYYVADLCPEPVNKLPRAAREHAREKGIAPLASLITDATPSVVVVVMLEIVPYVTRALREATRNEQTPLAPIHQLPFPRSEHRARYVRELSALLREFDQAGTPAHEQGTSA